MVEVRFVIFFFFCCKYLLFLISFILIQIKFKFNSFFHIFSHPRILMRQISYHAYSLQQQHISK